MARAVSQPYSPGRMDEAALERWFVGADKVINRTAAEMLLIGLFQGVGADASVTPQNVAFTGMGEGSRVVGVFDVTGGVLRVGSFADTSGDGFITQIASNLAGNTLIALVVGSP